MQASGWSAQIKAGRCKLEGKKVTPERGNGILRASENEFGGLTVEWVNHEGTTLDEYYITNISDNEFGTPKAGSKGVFMLRFKDSTNAKQLFWCQEKESSALQDFIEKTNNKLAALYSQQEEASGQPLPPPAGSNAPQTHNNPDLDNFMKMLTSSLNQAKSPGLHKILTIENMKALIEEDEDLANSLLEHLPEGQRTKEGLLENIASPQFRQALQTLSLAIESPEFPTILVSLGLDTSFATQYGDGIAQFIKAVLKKFGGEQT